MTDTHRSVEDLIAKHTSRTDEYEEFLEALQKATIALQHKLCTECYMTRVECETEASHVYSPMTPIKFLLLTIVKHKPVE